MCMNWALWIWILNVLGKLVILLIVLFHFFEAQGMCSGTMVYPLKSSINDVNEYFISTETRRMNCLHTEIKPNVCRLSYAWMRNSSSISNKNWPLWAIRIHCLPHSNPSDAKSISHNRMEPRKKKAEKKMVENRSTLEATQPSTDIQIFIWETIASHRDCVACFLLVPFLRLVTIKIYRYCE